MTRSRARVPSLRQPSAWILAASGLLLYVWAPMIVPGDALRSPGGMPGWLPWLAPPVLYGLLVVGVPGLTPVRRLAGAAALCALHAGLSLAVPPIVTALGAAAPRPWGESVWEFPAAPLLQLFAVPLVAFPLRDWFVRRSAWSRTGAEAVRTPTPSPLRTGRGWDDAGMHTAGGERLREVSPGRQPTPEWRAVRDLPPPPSSDGLRPVAPLPTDRTAFGLGRGEGGPGTLPATPAAPTPTLPRARFEVPAPEALPPTPSLATINTEPVVVPERVPPAPVEAVALPVLDEPRLVVEPALVEPSPPGMPGVAPPVAPEPGVGLAGEPAEDLAPVRAATIVEASLPARPSVEPAAIARALAPVGALEMEHETLMGIGLYTARGPRLARSVVTNAAFRVLTCLAEMPAREPVTQTTLRGAAGALVVTPLGPLAEGGPVLAVAIPQRGALALLEILTLRVAAEYRAAHAAAPVLSAAAAAPAGTLRETPVPARVGALVRPLTAGGALRPVCLEDASGGLTLHLLLGPEADAERLGRLASHLYRIMEIDAESGGVGPVHSVVVRLGSQRVVVQPVTPAGGRSTLLVAATASDPRAGLTRLQLERVAARLGSGPPP